MHDIGRINEHFVYNCDHEKWCLLCSNGSGGSTLLMKIIFSKGLNPLVLVYCLPPFYCHASLSPFRLST